MDNRKKEGWRRWTSLPYEYRKGSLLLKEIALPRTPQSLVCECADTCQREVLRVIYNAKLILPLKRPMNSGSTKLTCSQGVQYHGSNTSGCAEATIVFCRGQRSMLLCFFRRPRPFPCRVDVREFRQFWRIRQMLLGWSKRPKQALGDSCPWYGTRKRFFV